jgi:hypothetical protein
MPKSVFRPYCHEPLAGHNSCKFLSKARNGTSDLYMLRRAYGPEGKCPFPESQRVRIVLEPLRWNGGIQPDFGCRRRTQSTAGLGGVEKPSSDRPGCSENNTLLNQTTTTGASRTKKKG